MEKKYLVMNIGCLECGVSSHVVGIYSQEKEAHKVAKAQKTWREGGQSSPEVFEIEV